MQPRWNPPKPPRVSGHGGGDVDLVMSVESVAREAAALAEQRPDDAALRRLAHDAPLLSLRGLEAGYGRMQILHGLDLHVAAGQSLCLIGPNGAGKSTVLHSIYGFTRITGGAVELEGRAIGGLTPEQKLRDAGIAYVMQDNSVFPRMTVEENLLMGGYLMPRREAARAAAADVLARYPRLAQRRQAAAGTLSGGERRLLEIARALIMQPRVLLVDEPSIGLEPRYIDAVFEILRELQHEQGKTIVLVEQNAKKGLEFADLGYVLVSGQLAMAGPGDELLENPDVGRLFLGG